MLYAVGYAAFHRADPAGALPQGFTFGVEVVRADDDVQALDVGLRYARHRMPPDQGWTDHNVVIRATTSVLRPEEEWT